MFSTSNWQNQSKLFQRTSQFCLKTPKAKVFISFCLLQRMGMFQCLRLNKSWNMLFAYATSCTKPSAVKYYNSFVTHYTVSWLLQKTITGFSTYVQEHSKQGRVGLWIPFILRSFQSALPVKNNPTVGVSERWKTFVMVKLCKISLCKREVGLRSSSVKLKRSMQIKPDCGDDTRTATVDSVVWCHL